MTTRWDPEVLQKTGKLQQLVVKDETKSADMRPPTTITIIERPMTTIDKPIVKPRDPLTMETDPLTTSRPTEEHNSALAQPSAAAPRRRKQFRNTWYRKEQHWPGRLKPLIQQIETALHWKPERPFDDTELRFEATTAAAKPIFAFSNGVTMTFNASSRTTPLTIHHYDQAQSSDQSSY
jgi:hypothetical protein